MIVEDKHFFHKIYVKMLEDTGYELIHTYDGNEALSKLQEKKPDLIILDMLLDMMTGDTFFLCLKSIPEFADIPVIIISAYSKKEFKNLRNLDPNLMYIKKKHVNKQILLKEFKKVGF